MRQTTKDVFDAISSLEKVADELHPSAGKTITVTAKFTTDEIIAGNTYEVVNHSGHYYWLVCGGRWVDKDIFAHKKQ